MADGSDRSAGATAKPVIFISYSHKDEPDKPGKGEVKWLTYVRNYLQANVKDGTFNFWVDHDIPSRATWDSEFAQKLRDCDIFIPLLSAHYITSSYIDAEITVLSDRRARAEEFDIFPILLTPISKSARTRYEILYQHQRAMTALSEFPGRDRDPKMKQIANTIATLIELVAEKKKNFQPNIAPAHLPNIDNTGFPDPENFQFVGRERELKLLDSAWGDPRIRFVSIIGARGTGKTTLIRAWLKRMRTKTYVEKEFALVWSFESSGMGVDWTTESFFNRAIEHFGLGRRRKSVDPSSWSVTAKANAIAETMTNSRTLLVLDDVAVSPYRPNGRGGELRDQNLNSLVKHFAAATPYRKHGLIVVASQFSINGLTNRPFTTVIDLDAQSVPSGDVATEDNELTPPREPLPNPSPATHFVYVDGQFDVVPSTAWDNRGAQAAAYHARARALASALADRLARTDAVPDVAGSVAALISVLGDDITQVQPDQLRLASRSIAARARVYGHPAAEWEISAESVSNFFELADVLVDLQTFARTDLEAHETAIRQLDLTRESAAEAKVGLDLLTDVVLSAPELISERVEVAFDSAATISATAIDDQVKMAIEGDRTLISTNLALAVARELGRDKPVGGGRDKPPGKRPPDEPLEPEPRQPEKRKRQPRRKHEKHEHAWDNFLDRVMSRIHQKGPDAIGDATVQAAASIIKHSPKTVSGLAAALVLLATSSPILAGGAVAVTMAWIAYEIRRKNRPSPCAPG